MKILTGAAFLCVALVLLRLVASLDLFAPQTEAVASSPAAEKQTVVFLGSSADPLCEPLFSDLEGLCTERGWRLISYDSKGRAAGQKGQIEDFLRTEAADAAVLWPVLEGEELDGQIKALAERCPVVTVGQRPGTAAARLTGSHVGADETEQLRTLAGYLKKNMEKGQGALLLTDLPDEDAEERIRRVFSVERVDILGNNYTWGGAVYAERYLKTALDEVENVGAVVCVSRAGTMGTWNTLQEKGLRDKVKIVSLFYEPAMADDLALGELDAAVTVSPKETAKCLAELLPKVLKGEKTAPKALTPVLLTPENVDEAEF